MLDRVFSPGGNINEFLKGMGLYLGISLVLIFIQPDFGTILIILLTIMCMALFAGLDPKFIIGAILAGAVIIVIALVVEPYRMVRIQVLLNLGQMNMETGIRQRSPLWRLLRADCSAAVSATQP